MNSGQELLVDIFSDDEFDEDELKKKDNETEYVFEVLSKEQIVINKSYKSFQKWFNR